MSLSGDGRNPSPVGRLKVRHAGENRHPGFQFKLKSPLDSGLGRNDGNLSQFQSNTPECSVWGRGVVCSTGNFTSFLDFNFSLRLANGRKIQRATETSREPNMASDTRSSVSARAARGNPADGSFHLFHPAGLRLLARLCPSALSGRGQVSRS